MSEVEGAAQVSVSWEAVLGSSRSVTRESARSEVTSGGGSQLGSVTTRPCESSDSWAAVGCRTERPNDVSDGNKANIELLTAGVDCGEHRGKRLS